MGKKTWLGNMKTVILGSLQSLLGCLFAWPPIVYRSGHAFCHQSNGQKSVTKNVFAIKLPQKLALWLAQSLYALTTCPSNGTLIEISYNWAEKSCQETKQKCAILFPNDSIETESQKRKCKSRSRSYHIIVTAQGSDVIPNGNPVGSAPSRQHF